MTDGEILNALDENPEEGMRLLIREYERYVYAIVRRQLGRQGNWQDAEDCAAEAFAALYRARHRIAPERGSVLQYLAGAARNQARMLIRYRARHPAVELPEDAAAADEDGAIWELVERLPEKDGRLILRRYRDGYSMEEIAHEAGVGCAAVRKRISRAVGKLRRFAEEDSV